MGLSSYRLAVWQGFNRVIAALTSAVLAFTAVPLPDLQASPAPAPLSGSWLEPPPRLATLLESYQAPPQGASRRQPLVILIQDLHAHYGVQRQIAALLTFLADRLPASRKGLPYALFLEGGSGPIDLRVLATFPDAQVRTATADYLLREAMIGGPEYFAISRGLGRTLVGAEDPGYDEMHRTLYRTTFDARRRLISALSSVRQEMTPLHRRYPRSVRRLESRLNAWEAGRLTTGAFVEHLSTVAGGLHVTLSDVAPAIAERLGSDAGRDRLDADALESGRVHFEVTELAWVLKRRLVQGSPAEDWILVDHDIDLLLRVAALQATEDEVRAFAPRLDQFIALTKSLAKDAFDELEIRYLLSSSIDFYALAMVRNQPMIERTLAALDGADKDGPPSVAVLVAGGFHTGPMTALLRERGVSYLVMAPAVESLDDESLPLYESRLLGRALTPEAIAAASRNPSPALSASLAGARGLWRRHSGTLAVSKTLLTPAAALTALIVVGAALTHQSPAVYARAIDAFVRPLAGEFQSLSDLLPQVGDAAWWTKAGLVLTAAAGATFSMRPDSRRALATSFCDQIRDQLLADQLKRWIAAHRLIEKRWLQPLTDFARERALALPFSDAQSEWALQRQKPSIENLFKMLPPEQAAAAVEDFMSFQRERRHFGRYLQSAETRRLALQPFLLGLTNPALGVAPLLTEDRLVFIEQAYGTYCSPASGPPLRQKAAPALSAEARTMAQDVVGANLREWARASQIGPMETEDLLTFAQSSQSSPRNARRLTDVRVILQTMPSRVEAQLASEFLNLLDRLQEASPSLASFLTESRPYGLSPDSPVFRFLLRRAAKQFPQPKAVEALVLTRLGGQAPSIATSAARAAERSRVEAPRPTKERKSAAPSPDRLVRRPGHVVFSETIRKRLSALPPSVQVTGPTLRAALEQALKTAPEARRFFFDEAGALRPVIQAMWNAAPLTSEDDLDLPFDAEKDTLQIFEVFSGIGGSDRDASRKEKLGAMRPAEALDHPVQVFVEVSSRFADEHGLSERERAPVKVTARSVAGAISALAARRPRLKPDLIQRGTLHRALHILSGKDPLNPRAGLIAGETLTVQLQNLLSTSQQSDESGPSDAQRAPRARAQRVTIRIPASVAERTKAPGRELEFAVSEKPLAFASLSAEYPAVFKALMGKGTFEQRFDVLHPDLYTIDIVEKEPTTGAAAAGVADGSEPTATLRLSGVLAKWAGTGQLAVSGSTLGAALTRATVTETSIPRGVLFNYEGHFHDYLLFRRNGGEPLRGERAEREVLEPGDVIDIAVFRGHETQEAPPEDSAAPASPKRKAPVTRKTRPGGSTAAVALPLAAAALTRVAQGTAEVLARTLPETGLRAVGAALHAIEPALPFVLAAVVAVVAFLIYRRAAGQRALEDAQSAAFALRSSPWGATLAQVIAGPGDPQLARERQSFLRGAARFAAQA